MNKKSRDWVTQWVTNTPGVHNDRPAAGKLCVEVKSNQNYKSEWEEARFRATYSL